jgi:hypothetical protein
LLQTFVVVVVVVVAEQVERGLSFEAHANAQARHHAPVSNGGGGGGDCHGAHPLMLAVVLGARGVGARSTASPRMRRCQKPNPKPETVQNT